MAVVPAAIESGLYEEQADLPRLFNALRRARGFSLYFARCNSPSYRSRLVSSFQSHLKRPIIAVDLNRAGPGSLDDYAAQVLEDTPEDAVVFVYHLESFLPSGNPDRKSQTLSELNWRRAAFARLCRPLVFWLPEYALTILASGAPDFYDWYSGVYEFNAPLPQPGLFERGFYDVYGVEDLQSSRGLRLEEKGRWFALMRELAKTMPETTEALKNARVSNLKRLGFLALQLTHYSEAKKYFESALREDEAIYGMDDPVIANDVFNLGTALENLGDLDGAKAAFERSLKLNEIIFNVNDPRLGSDLRSIGSIFMKLGDLTSAQSAFERSLQIDETVLSSNNFLVAYDLNSIGAVLRRTGKLTQARHEFERAIKIIEGIYGDHDPDIAVISNNLGVTLLELGDLEGAQHAFERALRIDKGLFGVNHPRLAYYFNNLGGVYRAQGDFVEEKSTYEWSLAILGRYFNPDHPDVKVVQNNLDFVDAEMRVQPLPLATKEISC